MIIRNDSGEIVASHVDMAGHGDPNHAGCRRTLNDYDLTSHPNQAEIHHDEPEEFKKDGSAKSIILSLLSGAAAGAVAKTTIAPLDRTKILFQISHKPFTVKEGYILLRDGYRKDGILSWWRGNSATLARIIPYAALQFTVHQELKHLMRVDKNDRVLPPLRRFMAGSLSGISAAFCTYPLDMVRARLAVANKTKYSNLLHAMKTIYRQEGPRTFYHGFLPTVLGIIPYAGISFSTYETLKSFHHDYMDGREPTPLYRLAFGACAGLLGQTSSYPLDIVRRRMQTDGLDGKGYQYRNILNTIVYIWKREGLIGGFYKGLSINWVKGPVAVAISFTTYDLMQELFRKMLQEQPAGLL